ISSLVKTEPGAIYRAILSIRKSYSTYSCLGNTFDEKFEMEEIKEPVDEETTSYYYYGDYSGTSDSYEEGEEYEWRERENPCKSTYYRSYERAAYRNILASDLGITVKKGNDGSLFMVANDLITTKPVSAVDIELYDYQKQLIQVVKTNSDGQVFVSP